MSDFDKVFAEDLRHRARVLPEHERNAPPGELEERIRLEKQYRVGFHHALAMLQELVRECPGVTPARLLAEALAVAGDWRRALASHPHYVQEVGDEVLDRLRR
jgi:hypothetical protein